jgi:hypothetical protein
MAFFIVTAVNTSNLTTIILSVTPFPAKEKACLKIAVFSE